MLNPYLMADIAIAVVLFLISLFVISKNSKAQINRVFFVAVIFMSAWIVSNYYSNDQQLNRTSALIANHLILFFSGLLIYYLAYFAALLCNIKFFVRNVLWISIANYLVALLALTPLVIQDIVKQKSVYGLSFGPLAFIYFGAISVNAVAITYSLASGLKKSIGSERLRIQTVFWSLVTTLIIILFTNAVLPIVGIATLSNIGPLASIIFVTGVAYSIVRHKLFDIRSVVARSVAYILLLATLALLFVGGVFGITSIFFQQDNLSTAVRITFAFLAILLAFGLQPLKHFFDRTTNQLFYRDAYDSQALLNELNRSLVTTIDLKDLLTRSAKIIAETLKSQYCAFAIQEPGGSQIRLTGTKENFVEQDIKSLFESLSRRNKKIVVTDEIESTNSEIKKMLQEADISVLIKLQGTARGRPEHPGYILLGQKRSGNLYSNQDITVLEIIADELVIAIQNALRFEEIQQFNITLQEKIDEATKKLRHANVRLKELDATKDEFISMASHQLRTPLTTIKGYLSMILDGDVGKVKKEEKELIQHAFDSAQRMVYLIADLLNVSRLQTGKFVIENKPTDLAKVVDGEITQLGEQAATRNIRLAYAKPKEFPTLNLDETKIRQVIMNFLDNALYYTPKEGEVTAKLEATPESVNFTVTDTGVGVPASLQHHLFTKFYRADNARKMRPDGTGLGLYMAKKVIVAQGGAIIFKSTEGKGSTFGFSFPRRAMEVKA